MTKYEPLSQLFAGLAASRQQITLGFDEIERVIGRELPRSARDHRPWWANEATQDSRHVQCKSWLAAGWRVAQVNLESRAVTFERTTANKID